MLASLIRAFTSKPAPAQMNEADMAVIEAFAAGDELLRPAAIEAHYRNIAIIGVRGNTHQKFMAETDSPVPDYSLRAHYRRQLVGELAVAA